MIIMESSTLLEIYEPLESLGWSYSPVNNRVGVAEDNPERNKRGEASLIAKKPKTPAVDPKELLHCNICGRSRHEADSCTNPNPDRNMDSAVIFRQSTNGKKWLALGVSEVPFNVRLDGSLVDETKSGKRDKDVIAIMNATKQASKRPAPGGGGASRPQSRGQGQGGNKPSNKKPRTCKSDFDSLASLAAVTTSPRNVINATVHVNGQSKLFRCLIDTGCSQDNYASPLVRRWFTEAGSVVSPESEAMTHGSECLVCSPISKTCISCSSASVLTLTFLNERDNVNETTPPIKLKFLDTFISNRYDIIIGLDTICDYNIIFKLPKRFSNGTEVQGVLEFGQLSSLSPIESNTRSPNLDPREAKRPRKPATPHMTPYDSEDITGGLGFKEPALSWESEGDCIDVDLPTKVYGSVNFKLECYKLLREFSDVFSRTIDSSPSRVTPMTLNVDHDRWHAPKNQQGYRMQSTFKQDEIDRQVEKMLAAGVITTSQAPYYSQVHLVPKPNGKWRFTIDFRNLNDCCEQAGWPLPNITLMLQRIGTKKPRLFCKFDMTDGYHQFPLHPDSWDATTFITANGLYRFKRVVMGLSGSGSNFQARMSTEVLTGLLYIICESYLDDILLYATNETKLLHNLREILTRFRRHHILLNPDKVEIGLEQLEFVGHLIDSTGVHMTQAKLDSIRDFPKPTLKGDMKKFLGLANYFRDHVRDHSVLAYPLQQAIEGYSRKDRHHKIRWTPELETAYEQLKEAICNCQKLHYVDEEYPVYLQTDASDYGIGAYLKQVAPHGEIPIMFISKSLDKTQCRWSTPEKEMYAIWYALQKMDHLLRDIHFHIQTDHENLTRHKVTGSPKVLRWKLDIQQFNFTIAHIKGTDNVVADEFSRQCDREILEEEEEVAAIFSHQCDKIDVNIYACLSKPVPVAKR